MPEERRSWSSLDGPVTELTLSLGEPVTDDEIDLLCELARSGTADIIPGRPFAVNRTAEISGVEDVVLRDARGRYLINPDVQSCASDVFVGGTRSGNAVFILPTAGGSRFVPAPR